jgi:hypothetical protein
MAEEHEHQMYFAGPMPLMWRTVNGIADDFSQAGEPMDREKALRILASNGRAQDGTLLGPLAPDADHSPRCPTCSTGLVSRGHGGAFRLECPRCDGLPHQRPGG